MALVPLLLAVLFEDGLRGMGFDVDVGEGEFLPCRDVAHREQTEIVNLLISAVAHDRVGYEVWLTRVINEPRNPATRLTIYRVNGLLVGGGCGFGDSIGEFVPRLLLIVHIEISEGVEVEQVVESLFISCDMLATLRRRRRRKRRRIMEGIE
jgi:hypothetical protein